MMQSLTCVEPLPHHCHADGHSHAGQRMDTGESIAKKARGVVAVLAE